MTVAELQKELNLFRNNFQTLILSTVSKEGKAHASYAPFILGDDQAMYILSSELAAHTQNMLNHPQVGVLFIENEADSKTPFARKRISLECSVFEVGRISYEWKKTIEKMEATFGNIIPLLKSLSDFHLFRMDVEQGSFVKGFGQAYSVQGNELQILARKKK